jgi:hypothetical protein
MTYEDSSADETETITNHFCGEECVGKHIREITYEGIKKNLEGNKKACESIKAKIKSGDPYCEVIWFIPMRKIAISRCLYYTSLLARKSKEEIVIHFESVLRYTKEAYDLFCEEELQEINPTAWNGICEWNSRKNIHNQQIQIDAWATTDSESETT